MNTIELSVFGLTIHDGNTITSDLLKQCSTNTERAYMDCIESMVLAHHCAGIDVTTPQYKEGIEVAVESFWNNM